MLWSRCMVNGCSCHFYPSVQGNPCLLCKEAGWLLGSVFGIHCSYTVPLCTISTESLFQPHCQCRLAASHLELSVWTPTCLPIPVLYTGLPACLSCHRAAIVTGSPKPSSIASPEPIVSSPFLQYLSKCIRDSAGAMNFLFAVLKLCHVPMWWKSESKFAWLFVDVKKQNRCKLIPFFSLVFGRMTVAVLCHGCFQGSMNKEQIPTEGTGVSFSSGAVFGI